MSTITHHTDPLSRYAESAWQHLDLRPPADLQAVCDRLKILLRRKTLDRDICGFLIVTPNRIPVIVVNEGMPIPRQRWSIAHEIGHHLIELKHKPGLVCKMLESGPVRPSLNERRADLFAASLLMPFDVIRSEHSRLASNPSGRVPIMADRFGVSHQALRIRLKELGLDAGSHS